MQRFSQTTMSHALARRIRRMGASTSLLPTLSRGFPANIFLPMPHVFSPMPHILSPMH